MSSVPTRLVHATGPATVADLLRGDLRPAHVLGAFPTAIYLRLDDDAVMAVLARDATRLPLGVRLPTDSTEQPLDRWTGPVLAGAGQLVVGDRSIRISRFVSVTAPTGLTPNRHAVASAWRALGRFGEVEPRPGVVDGLVREARMRAPTTVVDDLLGAGPGLTPSGDDILAGYLVGAWSFALAEDRLRAAVLEASPGATTELSAALLRCAVRGESIPELSRFVSALADGTASTLRWDRALTSLGYVGHTSGAALATGALAAARVAGGRSSLMALHAGQPLVSG